MAPAVTKAVVTFLVEEHTVDDLLESTLDSDAPSGRWLVVGRDMPLLAALVAHWGPAVDISVLHAPAGTTAVAEAVLLMLEHEGLHPGACLWLVDDPGWSLPAEAGEILDISLAPPAELAHRLLALR